MGRLDDAKKDLLDHTPQQYFERWLLATTPFAFDTEDTQFAAFRRELSDSLEVHPAELFMVGSAQLGFSLHPDHLLRAFSAESDLDVVVVSPTIFDAAWRDLLQRRGDPALLETEQKRLFKKTRENFFDGYLRPDHLPTGSQLLRSWFPRLAGPFKSTVAQKHDVRAWLFRTWLHAESFYCNNIERVRPAVHKMTKPKEPANGA